MDSEGHQFLVWEDISYHKSYGTAISVADGFIISQGENTHPKKTTCGWELLTQMKEGVSKWVSTKDIKERKPVDLAEYVAANRIDHDTAFAWWVPFTLCKRNM